MEIDRLKERGYLKDDAQLKIGLLANIHLPLPHPPRQGAGREAREQEDRTTARGIGPCYEDKIARVGIRGVRPPPAESFAEKLRANLEAKNFLLKNYFGGEEVPFQATLDESSRTGTPEAPPHRTSLFVNEEIARGAKLLFEGPRDAARHRPRDVPVRHLSNTTAGGACTGSGVGPTKIGSVIGVSKAYADARRRRAVPHGAVRRRGAEDPGPRERVWIDHGAAAAMRLVRRPGRAVRQSPQRAAGLALTKLDVLSGLPSVKVCVAYEIDGARLEQVPLSLTEFEAASRSTSRWRAGRKTSPLPGSSAICRKPPEVRPDDRGGHFGRGFPRLRRAGPEPDDHTEESLPRLTLPAPGP